MPLLAVLAGAIGIAGGLLLLRGLGPRVRVGRLLGSAPSVTVAEAAALAKGPRRYIQVRGRIDSSEEFEDADHRPLVLRRRRVELRGSTGWIRLEDDLETVPFELHEGLDSIAVDGPALGDGLVVVPRMSEGTAADAPDRVPPGTDPTTPVRLVVEQVSSVEHAIVAGVPQLDPAGSPILTAGLGRPLVLTTLEPDEAMRVLAGGRSRRVRLAAALMAVGVVLIGLGIAWFALASTVLAASPSPTAAGGDTRSGGEGPGLVGEPGLAIVAVLAIGLIAVLATAAYVRLTRPPADRR